MFCLIHWFCWRMKVCFGLTIRKRTWIFSNSYLMFYLTKRIIYFQIYVTTSMNSHQFTGQVQQPHSIFSFFSCSPHIFLLLSAHNRIWVWDRSAVGFEIKESWLPVHLWWGMYCHTVLYSRLPSPAVAHMWKCIAQIFMRCFDFNRGDWLDL